MPKTPRGIYIEPGYHGSGDNSDIWEDFAQHDRDTYEPPEPTETPIAQSSHLEKQVDFWRQYKELITR
jgi:hypothetical protein